MRQVRYLAIAVLLLSPALLGAEDLFLGRWVLDPKVSRYPAGHCPKQMTIEMSVADGGVHYHSETRLMGGQTFSADYIAAYDDKPAMVTGTKGVLLPISLKQIRPNTVIARYTRGFETVATSRRTLSVDGQLMTVTTSSKDRSGKLVTNTGRYRKVSSRLNGNGQ